MQNTNICAGVLSFWSKNRKHFALFWNVGLMDAEIHPGFRKYMGSKVHRWAGPWLSANVLLCEIVFLSSGLVRMWPVWQREGDTQANTFVWASWRCRPLRTEFLLPAAWASPYARSLCTQWEGERRRGVPPHENSPRPNPDEILTPNSALPLRLSTLGSARGRAGRKQRKVTVNIYVFM